MTVNVQSFELRSASSADSSALVLLFEPSLLAFVVTAAVVEGGGTEAVDVRD